MERNGQRERAVVAKTLFSLVLCQSVSSSVWHYFFFFFSLRACVFICFFSFFFILSCSLSFHLAALKNVLLLWGKGLRGKKKTKKRLRWKRRGHRDEEEGGNDSDGNDDDKGCVGTRVIAPREIRFLFFRRRTVRRRSRYDF